MDARTAATPMPTRTLPTQHVADLTRPRRRVPGERRPGRGVLVLATIAVVCVTTVALTVALLGHGTQSPEAAPLPTAAPTTPAARGSRRMILTAT
jgi:hypothetical protein